LSVQAFEAPYRNDDRISKTWASPGQPRRGKENFVHTVVPCKRESDFSAVRQAKKRQGPLRDDRSCPFRNVSHSLKAKLLQVVGFGDKETPLCTTDTLKDKKGEAG